MSSGLANSLSHSDPVELALGLITVCSQLGPVSLQWLMKMELEADPGHGETALQRAPLAQRPRPSEPAPALKPSGLF